MATNLSTRRWLSVAGAIATTFFAASFAVAADVAPAPSPSPTSKVTASAQLDQQLDVLIRELGSPQYTVRRAAANEIRKIGPEAFDSLHAATESSDPEIAASASYLLRQIAVRWTKGDDSATVKRLMRSYGDREDGDRQRIIQMLSVMPSGEGVPALCRIARYDRTPLLSRLAALAIIQTDQADNEKARRNIDTAAFDEELGESTRAPVQWLRQFAIQLRDPTESVAGWLPLIDAENKRLEVEVNETSPALVSALLWNLAEVHRQLGQHAEYVEVADRYLTLGGNDSERLLTLLKWLVRNESWQTLEEFAEHHHDEIQRSKQTLYMLAVARSKQNQGDGAEELAQQAAKLPTDRPIDSLDAGRLLEILGQHEWAIREYQSGIDGQPIEAASSIGARVMLSNLLQDHERYDAAADALAPLVDAIEKNPDVKRAYLSALGDLSQQSHYVPEANALAARMHYLRACHHEQEHDFTHQRQELLAAIKADETDADVLIAMFRLADADDAWMADTRERIKKLARNTEARIEDQPNDPIAYNQWAWLIANTEGDFQKAVRLSRRSLELEPDTASFLDTLGRCYYSAGEYQKAVESQRQAVALIPHMQIMQRQLRQFEQKVAELKKPPTTK
jgi:tetratricopeptide (TPR) repeat protein